MTTATICTVPDRRAAARQAVGAVLAAAGVLLVAPRPAQAWQTLRAPGDALDPTAPLLAVLALAAWALGVWLLLAVLLAATARLPGAAGRVADALAARTVPSSVRRVTGVLLGAGLVLGLAAPAGAAEPAVGNRAEAVVSLDWPVVTTGSGTSPSADPDTSPGTDPETGPATRPAAPRPAREPAGAEAVLVRPGDSLWALAERGLRMKGTAEPSDAQVAAAWPSWWSANREAVGEDPHLLLPGTRLVTPPD